MTNYQVLGWIILAIILVSIFCMSASLVGFNKAMMIWIGSMSATGSIYLAIFLISGGFK